MATLSDLITEVLRDREKLTSVEIFGHLPNRARQATRDPKVLETALRQKPDRFVCNSHTGEWSLRSRPTDRDEREVDVPQPAPQQLELEVAPSEPDVKDVLQEAATDVRRRLQSERPSPARRSRQVRLSRTTLIDPPSGPVGDLEMELRARLLGRRIVAEIGLDAALHEQVEATLEQVLKVRWTDDELTAIPQRYPALLTTYLVGHGVYRYRAGDFWGSVAVPGIDRRAGVTFETSVALLGLETFEDLVAGDNATRFIGPILAHGGIPKYCLDDYFTLLLRDLGKVDGDARDLMAFWRTRKSAFLHVDKPVRRFLLYGGDLAVDFLDRTIDMVRTFEAIGAVGRPEEIGLPPYVVAGYRRLAKKSPARIIRVRGPRVPRPEIRLDPWAPFGPELELPKLPAELAGASWRIQTAGQVQRVAGSNHESRTVSLQPAAAWTAELHLDDRVEREVTFEGFDAIPALFFDPADGRLLAPAAGLRANDTWLLAPVDVEVAAISVTGEIVELPLLDDLPDPTGSWSGLTLKHVSLSGCRAIQVRSGAAGRERRISVRPPAERPELVGQPIERIVTDGGLPVFSEFPQIHLPSSELEDSQWFINLGFEGTRTSVAASDLPDGSSGLRLDHLVPAGRAGVVSVVIRGALGADLRAEFAYVPGLALQMPERLLFPDDPAGDVQLVSPFVAINDGSPGQTVHVSVPADADDVAVVVRSEGAAEGSELGLVVQVAKVMWGLVRRPNLGTDLANEQVTFSDDEIAEGDVVALVVRTRQYNLPLELALVSNQVPIHVSDRTTTGRGEGRWLFDLKRFGDTIRQGISPNASLVLRVGVRPVTVARIRPSWGARITGSRSRIAGDFASVDIDFESDRELSDRVLRLWSLDRLWEPPIVERIPDGARDSASVSGYERIPAGRYLVELDVDDGWGGAPQRPNGTDGNVVSIVVGTSSDVNNRLWKVSTDDPFNVLEVALATGRIARDLEDEERALIMPAAVRSALVMLEDPDSRVLTSGRFRALRFILCAGPDALASSLVDVAEGGYGSPASFLMLAISLTGDYRIGRRSDDTSDDDERVMRSLWAISPALAAMFDLEAMKSGDGQDRAREFLGWDPDEDLSEVFIGQPVTQQWMGIPAEQVESIRRSIDLVPKRVLSEDAFIAALIEWLLLQKADPAAVDAWWRDARPFLRRFSSSSPHAAAHLDGRRPPTGTTEIAAVPQAVLAAALTLVDDSPEAEDAAKLLTAAAAFAPRLVERDLVLARLLTLHALDPEYA